MTVCPKCKTEIDNLNALETRETELTATYDPENEELELEVAHPEEWVGNPIGEQTAIKFSCPICGAELFNTEQEAREFLSQSMGEKRLWVVP